MSWAGRVYDGPWEGRSYSSERPYFTVAIVPPLYGCAFDPRDLEPPMFTCSCRGVYIWSRALKCWVFDWVRSKQG